MANIIKLGGSGGGSSVIVSKTITTNGTYNASVDSADGYNPVVVNVSGGGVVYEDLTAFAFYEKRNTTTPTLTHEDTNEVSLSFTDQNAQGYEVCAFSVPLNKGVYVAEIYATVDTITGLATQYTWGIYSANASGGATLNSNAPKDNSTFDTYVPFDRTDTNEHYYELPINMTADGTAYISFATAADNGTNATISVRSLKIRKAYGGSNSTLKLNEGKLTLTDGTIATNPDYYYSDEFECPQGSFFFDFGGQLNLNAGIVWYDSNGVYKNYYQANQRYRTVNMGSFYQAGYKMRVGLPKTALNNTILIDYNTGKIYNAYDLVKLTT